jgi:forespore regulator of the sigma-K checkpoint
LYKIFFRGQAIKKSEEGELMSLANLIKQLKKQLKSGKRRLTLGLIFLLLAACYIGVGLSRDSHAVQVLGVPELEQQQQVLKQIEKNAKEYEVFSQKEYVCGQETARIGKLSATEISQYHKEHLQDQIKLSSDQVYFIEQIEDLSAECKKNAFFGLDNDGRLSLFEGHPDKEHIIRTFFQLNVDHLKTSLPQGTFNQLMQGIPVSDLAEYNSVLSTFSDYALEVNSQP